MSGTCATCKHWSKDGGYQRRGVGECEAVMEFWEASKWDEDTDERVIAPEHASVTAFAQDGSDYRARLFTRPEHGCTMYAPRTPYPFCRHPDRCAGLGSCPRDPTCAD